jgi:pimeloyl-ACP methyl ester carboxylesterase
MTETVFNSKVFVVEAGDRSKQTVLLIHGMGQIGFKDWMKVIPALEENYHIVALDLPGYGRSDKPNGKYSPTNYARVVHQLKEKYSSDPVLVVGHSMGGAVSLRYVAMYPSDVKSAVLVSAAGILERSAFVKHSLTALIDGKQMPSLLDGAKSLVDEYGGSVVEWINQLPDPTRVLGNYELLWGRLLVNRSNANAGLALVEENFSSAIFNNSKRITIIWGRNDNVAPLRIGKLLQGQLQNSSLTIIENADHVPMNSQSIIFNDLLLRALRGDIIDSDVELKNSTPSQSLHCKDKRGEIFSGDFTDIIIENCQGIVLQNVSAESLVIKNSRINIENTVIKSTAMAVSVEHSLVVATNLKLYGETGIRVANSRLDLAGASIKADGSGIVVDEPSTLVFSISQLDSKDFTGQLHGQYSLKKGQLIQDAKTTTKQ